ncbi:MAG: hypothetical protein II942_03710 [Alphaproteobacteria bacterium]|nr:hypothetical protein [Alphaproteobacteria bacterium]
MKHITAQRIFLIVFGIAICLALCSCGKAEPSADMGRVDLSIQSCWPCVIYGVVFDMIDRLVKSGVTSACSIGLVILALGGVWTILFKVGRMMFPFIYDKNKKGGAEEHDMASDLKSLIPIGLKGMFVALLLWRSNEMLDMFRLIYESIGTWFIGLANSVLKSVEGMQKYFPEVRGVSSDFWAHNSQAGVIVNFNGKMSSTTIAQSVFGSLGVQVQYIVSRVYGTLSNMIPLAANLLTEGGFLSWLLALYTMYQVVILTLVFPLVFVDSFVQLVFIMCVFPILLALWVFPGQDKYLKSFVPNDFIGPFANIVMGTIFLVVMMTLLGVYSEVSLSSMLNYKTGAFNAAVVENARVGKPDIMIMVILLLAVRKLAERVGETTDNLMGTKLGSGGAIWKLAKQAEGLARKFAVGAVKLTAIVATGGVASVGTIASTAAKTAASAAAQTASGRNNSGSGGSP